MNKRAISMISGGLDSLLATKLMLEQGIEIIGINFTSIFCTCTSRKRKEEGCHSEALKVSKELGIPVKTFAKGLDYFKMVEHPKFGYGKGINPCIDCRIYILKKAKELMKEYDASFIVTGEVLGQRPMSQMKTQLKIIEKEAGLENLIVRPLSAHLLPETMPEKEGIVDRSKLLAISGRRRKDQINLAEQFGLNDYPCPSGGCLLTDKIFSKRIKDIFVNKKDYNLIDLKLVKLGRHFRIDNNCKIIVGRNENENIEISKLAMLGDYSLFIPIDIPGPSIIVDGNLNSNIEKIVNFLLFKYSDTDDKNRMLVKHKNKKEGKELIIKKEDFSSQEFQEIEEITKKALIN